MLLWTNQCINVSLAVVLEPSAETNTIVIVVVLGPLLLAKSDCPNGDTEGYKSQIAEILYNDISVAMFERL